MRGNWEAAEAMIISPNHRLSQQPNILEERHPLHLSSTPGWGIADRTVVKEEPIDDKASDSGVSPDHYSSSSSSKSRRSSANCSLSPGSSTSHDSNTVQCANYNEYSPMDCSKSHLNENGSNNNDQTQNPDENEKMDVASDETKDDSKETTDLKCPLANCSFTTRTRIQFSEHLANHYSANDMPDFKRFMQNKGQYWNSLQLSPMGSDSNRASPSQGDRSEQGDRDFDDTEEPGIRVPRVNSQGKIKTFTCKQCNFTCITKLEFWDHSRGHIKVEKLLTCPKCPFVTEYKHHLEYHLRNHFGSKPFKCDKCSYTCVNKSMLNSHLKSHSNIYQYRCANCSYATKYLHSLKLHLRKYTHQPAMVLNADGTPNPLPIVDVYGTRRGPKQKNLTPKLANEATANTNRSQSPVNKPVKQSVTPSQMSPTINPLNVLTSFPGANGINPIVALQYNQLFNAKFPMGNPFGINDETREKQLEHIRQSFCAEYAKAIVNEKMHAELSQDGSLFAKMLNYNNHGVLPTELPAAIASINSKIDMTTRPMIPDLNSEGKITPLDLSKPDIVQEVGQKLTTGAAKRAGSSKTSGTSRRKGKAFKLAVRDHEHKDEEEHHDDAPLRLSISSPPPMEQKELNELAVNNIDNTEAVSNNEFMCQFCQISFGNEVMYTVHMGYHGYKNPFTCNMCGHQCDDKVSFFLHIARSKHA